MVIMITSTTSFFQSLAPTRCQLMIATALHRPVQGRALAPPSTPATQPIWNPAKLTMVFLTGMGSLMRTLEKIMRHPPLLTFVVTKQLSAGHIEDAPAHAPHICRAGSIGVL